MARRTNERIQQDREIAWENLRSVGVNLYTMCLACGEIAHCRGAHREGVRCGPCFIIGTSGARLRYTVLHELRPEAS